MQASHHRLLGFPPLLLLRCARPLIGEFYIHTDTIVAPRADVAAAHVIIVCCHDAAGPASPQRSWDLPDIRSGGAAGGGILATQIESIVPIHGVDGRIRCLFLVEPRGATMVSV